MKQFKQILLFCIFFSALASQNEIILQTHKWCPKSVSALKIFNKAEQLFSNSLKFTLILHQNESYSGLPLPQITINCPPYSLNYESQLTYLQFSYWVNLLCMKKIPSCNKFDNKTSLSIHKFKEEGRLNKLSEYLLERPAIKVCESNDGMELSQEEALGILGSLNEIPYFTKFTHNIRHQLLKNSGENNQICVLLLSAQKKGENVKEKQFTQLAYMLRNRSNKLGFHIKQTYRKRIIFVSDHFQTKMATKLLHFLQAKPNNSSQIWAIGFTEEKQLWGTQYHGQIDNYLIFWIQRILSKNTLFNEKPMCLKNQIQHNFQINSLLSIRNSLKLKEVMTVYEKKGIGFEKIQTLYPRNSQFKLCIKDEAPIYYKTLQQLINGMQQKFSAPASTDQEL